MRSHFAATGSGPAGAIPILWLAMLLGMAGCQGLAGVDRSLVNHPAMDLTTRRIPAAQTILSPLDNGNGGSAVGCVTCIH